MAALFPNHKSAVINLTGVSGSLIAAVAGERIRVYGLVLALDAAQKLTLFDGATALTGGMKLSFLQLPPGDEPWFVTSPGNALDFTVDVSTSVNGVIYYEQD